MMIITESIELLKAYDGPLRLKLHQGASEELISKVESTHGVTLPDDFKEFYRFSDGFETDEDIFNMIPLVEIIENKARHHDDPFYIAEYMIYSDVWQLQINPDDCSDYKIFVEANEHQLVLTNSLAEFIVRFLKGGVFDTGGLYDWHEEVELQPIYATKLKTAELLLTVFYYSVRFGMLSTKEVINWADQIIMHENEPEYFFMELSLSRDENELLSHLNSVRVPETHVVARGVLGLLYRSLSNGVISGSEVIAIIDKCNFMSVLTPIEKEYIYDFTDENWLNDPIIEEDELVVKLLTFLAHYKKLEVANYKQWYGLSFQIEYIFKEKEKKN